MNQTPEYISIAEYCRLTGHQQQNIYRWIRENKLSDPDIKIQEKILKVVTIDKNLQLKTAWTPKRKTP